MRILIFGAGAIGSVVGGFMAKAGHAVTLVGRQPHMDAIRERGLRITGIWGEHAVTTLETRTRIEHRDMFAARIAAIARFATDDGFEELKEGGYDLVLVTVKSYDTRAAAKAIHLVAPPDTLVCSYQNGLGNVETLAEVLPPKQVFGARAIYGAWLPEPGHADVTVIANPTALGTYHPATPVERVLEIATAMNDAGLPTEYAENIATVLWSKVAYNCAMNPLSALLDVPYGGLLDSEYTKDIMRDVVRELYAVAQAMKVILDPATPEAYIELLFNVLIPPTAEHYASMREDIRRHKRTEIDALNGAICRYAENLGIPCPTNTTLTRLIRAREQR